MRNETRQALNAINRAFYREAAASFSATREAPWPGWIKLLPALEQAGGCGSCGIEAPPPIRILDVGCGNGRFARFLAEELSRPFSYLGLDASEPLLAQAAADTRGIAEQLDATIEFETWDFVEESFPAHLEGEAFEVINLSGVMHHIPSFALRRSLLEALAERLDQGGVLVLALWQFAEEERFRRKLISRKAFAERLESVALPAPDPDDLEEGDYLLPWGADGKALRYCHQVDEDEAERLLAGLPLDIRAAYRADGREGRLNKYVLLRKA